MKAWKYLFLVGSVLPLAAHAGAESHGGQVVVCPGKETVMLDYYQATLPTEGGGVPELVDLSQMSEADIAGFLMKRIQDSLLDFPYLRASAILGSESTWIESSLQSVSDSDPAFLLPPDCSLHQVAIRQDSTMYVDPAYLSQLSPAQRGILVAHENLYYVAQQNGLDSSVEVRMVLRNLLMMNLNEVALAKAVHELGNQFYWWEPYTELTYSGFSAKYTSITLKLSYDPILNPGHIGYVLLVVPVSDTPAQASAQIGQMTCDVPNQGWCVAGTGSGDCTIGGFIGDPSGGALRFLKLTCGQNFGIDEELTSNGVPLLKP